jgi:RNA polymerase sigma-70 factor, ECF subfamily
MQPVATPIVSSVRGVEMDAQPEQPGPAQNWSGPWPSTHAEFASLVEAYLDRLVRYALRQLGNIQDAEDVVQEVFVRAMAEPAAAGNRVRAVGPYLYRSVGNACTDLLRKRNRAAVFREEVGMEQALLGRDDPRVAAQAAEELRRAEQLLRRLPEEQAEAVRLRIYDGLRLNEIAELAGCSVNTICSRLRYGFRKLREMVAEQKESKQ